MVCLFVNFVMANSVFMHTHICVDGSRVTHSHPYMPGTCHTHTSQALTAIGAFNAAAAGMESSSGQMGADAPAEWHRVYGCAVPHVCAVVLKAAGERGPPARILSV